VKVDFFVDFNGLSIKSLFMILSWVKCQPKQSNIPWCFQGADSTAGNIHLDCCNPAKHTCPFLSVLQNGLRDISKKEGFSCMLHWNCMFCTTNLQSHPDPPLHTS